MELKDFLNGIDKRKNTVTLYKIYGITDMNAVQTDSNQLTGFLGTCLDLNTAEDVFGISPTAALEYEVTRKDSNLGMLLANNIAETMQLNMDGFWAAYDAAPDEEKKDMVRVTSKEYSNRTVERTVYDPKGKVPLDQKNKRNVVAVIAFHIPVSELEKYPACYNVEHEGYHTAKSQVVYANDLLALTLQDRVYEMESKVYVLKSFAMTYKVSKKTGKDEVKISEIVMEEVLPNVMGE